MDGKAIEVTLFSMACIDTALRVFLSLVLLPEDRRMMRKGVGNQVRISPMEQDFFQILMSESVRSYPQTISGLV